MAHLIDKDALVAEIKRRIDSNNEIAAYYSSNSEHDYLCRVKEATYKSLLSFIDTLEIKEVNSTDTFIEKACEWLKENKDKYLYNTGGKDEYIPTCSNKIINDFRKYMKGE